MWTSSNTLNIYTNFGVQSLPETKEDDQVTIYFLIYLISRRLDKLILIILFLTLCPLSTQVTEFKNLEFESCYNFGIFVYDHDLFQTSLKY